MIQTAAQAVGATTYPGRGIIVGKSADGKRAVMAYFIMGRSVNSRNRVFVDETGGIRTEAFDPSKMQDPSLIIYWPVREIDNKIIVTNGDQTDTIYEYVGRGATFADALRTRKFEPDAPNFTPRVSAMATFETAISAWTWPFCAPATHRAAAATAFSGSLKRSRRARAASCTPI